MKRYIKTLSVILGLSLLISCNDWLTVTPKGQVEASDLLETTEGYCSALSGIYYIMMQPEMYGRELSYGFVDQLAQYWKLPSKTGKLYPAFTFDYNHKNCIDKVKTFWAKFYLAIAQCNQLLVSLEKANPDDIDQYDMIKGELLGLRAFLHMQLLNIYGPVVIDKADLDQKAIAYRTNFDTEALKFHTVKEVLAKSKTDLLAALELLKNDPIKQYGRIGNGNVSTINYRDLLDRRGSRMNYFSILGLLAREEQLALNQDGAYTYAKRLLDECEMTIVDGNPVFFLTKKESIATDQNAQRDIMFSDELIFSLYINNLYDITGPVFSYPGYTVSNDYYVSADKNVNAYIYGTAPDGSGLDYRLNYWFSNGTLYIKYQKAPEIGGTTWQAYRSEISMMRLPEIYYIACEAQIGKDNTLALKYLNAVRVSRGLQPLANDYGNEEIMNFLVREKRKEFFGEGKMFFEYKRLNRDIDVTATKKIAVNRDILQLPIPEDEYEFSPNEKK